MTQCVAQRLDLNGDRVMLALNVRGHANYAENGKDIVCAAVSCLCVSLANTLLTAGVEKKQFCMEDGLFYVSATVAADNQYAIGAYDMAVNGLQSIAEQYPSHVTFTSGVSH